MKVISQGSTQPWWVGKQGKCWQCGSVIEFERDDTPDLYDAQDQRDNDSASLPCPTAGCGKMITVTPGTWIGGIR